MTTASLTIGSALLSFSPTLSLLLLVVFPKPQLLILAICAAFAYLLSALGSSALWWLFSTILPTQEDGGWTQLLSIVLPSVFIQFLVRCAFVRLYYRVEKVIQKSVARHEAESLSDDANTTSNDDTTTTTPQQQQQHGGETNALQLQLNDLSCSLASGSGYAFFHSLFLYGTLLASESYSESSNNNGGTLYQPSCSLPSLIHGALISGMFSVLDVIWMMATFYGMRRRLMYNDNYGMVDIVRDGLTFPIGLPDSRKGGNASLALVLMSHLCASLVLAFNGNEDGCKTSLSLLGCVLVLTGVVFVRGVKGHYLPGDQRRRIEELGGLNGRHVD